jgi:hypothetical protein
MGYEFGGQRHIIKLYLKDDLLTKLRIDLIMALMSHVLGGSAGGNAIMSVLDVRRAKLISGVGATPLQSAAIDGPIAWRRLNSRAVQFICELCRLVQFPVRLFWHYDW